MLQNIRDNSQGWIAKIIIGIIVVLMAFTGFDAIMNVSSTRDHAANVNGQVITTNELNQMVELQRRQLLQQLGKDFDPSLIEDKMLRESVLKGLIDRSVQLQGARDAGLVFSTQAMDQMLLSTPEFQVDGQFSAARFDQFVRERGMSRLQFRQTLEDEIVVNQMRAGIAASAFVTDEEREAFVNLDQQTREFAQAVISADATAVNVTEADINEYYEQNPQLFMSQEKVVLEYVELKKDAFFDQVEVDQEALQALYEREIANLAEQRQAAHILVEITDERNKEQAKEAIDALTARLANGEDFAALAKEASDDLGSKEEGGDLGFAGPGVYEPAFEEALYALKQGEVSAPVETPYGWHLIKLLAVQAPEVPSFDSLKDKLTAELKSQEVERSFMEASKQLADSAFEASDLAQPAQELGLTVQVAPAMGREGGEGILANRQVIKEAFSPEVLEDGANSSLLELDPNTAVVLRVKEHQRPAKLPLADVSERIRERLIAERATQLVLEKGEAALKALREGSDTELSFGQVQTAHRNEGGVSQAVLSKVFAMPKPADASEYAGVVDENGNFVLIKLMAVNAPAKEQSAEEKSMFTRVLASRLGEQDISAYQAELKNQAEIELY